MSMFRSIFIFVLWVAMSSCSGLSVDLLSGGNAPERRFKRTFDIPSAELVTCLDATLAKDKVVFQKHFQKRAVVSYTADTADSNLRGSSALWLGLNIPYRITMCVRNIRPSKSSLELHVAPKTLYPMGSDRSSEILRSILDDVVLQVRERRKNATVTTETFSSTDLADRPNVEVSSPEGNQIDSEEVTIVIAVHGLARISDVTMTVNGDPVSLPTEREIEKKRNADFSTAANVPLLVGRNLVYVSVTDENGHVGYASVVIDRKDGNDEQNMASTLKPERKQGSYEPSYRHRVGVVIGINSYEHWPVLEGASGDAKRVAKMLRKIGFDEVIEVYDGGATRSRILKVLGDELPSKTSREDLAVIFFAGHGQTETLANGEKRGYIIPADGEVDDVFSTGISMETLRDLSNRIPAKHIYYAMDSCYSGLGFSRGIAAIRKTAGYVNKITALPVVQMITAGMDGEEAVERGGRGLFTTYLLRAMGGEADVDGDGYVTAGEIGSFVRPGVTAASNQHQTPLYGTLDGSGEVVFHVPR